MQDSTSLSPTFREVVLFLRLAISPHVQIRPDTELVDLLCRSPIGDIEVCVHRSVHNGNVFIEVNMYGLGRVVPPLVARMTRLIGQVNDFGLGGVVMVIDEAIVFRQSIAVEQEHLDCWRSRLWFMLNQGMQMALRVKLYLSRNLADVELDDTGEPTDTTDLFPSGRIDPSWN